MSFFYSQNGALDKGAKKSAKGYRRHWEERGMEFATFVDLVRKAGGCRDDEGKEAHGMQVIVRIALKNKLDSDRVVQFFQEFGLRCDCQVPILETSNRLLQLTWLTIARGKGIELGWPIRMENGKRIPTSRPVSSSCEAEGA